MIPPLAKDKIPQKEGVYPPFKSSLLLFPSSCRMHFCRGDVGSRVSRLEHAGLWICSQITNCMDDGAAPVALPWLCPALEKSGDALAGENMAGEQGHAQREMPLRAKVAGTERAGEAREAWRRGG